VIKFLCFVGTADMKFGFTLPSFTWPGLDYPTTTRITKEMARRAEELGYDSLTVWDQRLIPLFPVRSTSCR
jgi:alkanesulfonate monooxygenase SsuD/methylene tetrahydromethanopterin reductase-like flavin-dependent oxidoreductase (luciferase family)